MLVCHGQGEANGAKLAPLAHRFLLFGITFVNYVDRVAGTSTPTSR
jgi:hypothetical protein